ncbi:MAG: hypothetical protein RL483_768 [Pseudomonadota bacterium]|jgi:orotate phosphoribosyltransferase
MPSQPATFQHDFLAFAIQSGVLKFGSFTTKAGRKSPYFFNAGLFYAGGLLGRLADFYAQALLAAQASGRLAQANLLFGPAYKGITLASATAVALAARGHDIQFAYNRKEAKDHGEGGLLVGAPMAGQVVIVDDVISAGTSVRESVQIIKAEGATPVGVLIALDRMEKGGTADAPTQRSATQEVQDQFGIPVVAIATLADLLGLLEQTSDPALAQSREAVQAYRTQWGVA